MTQRIGIFGGSFDPIHLGHLIMAEMFRESMQLDRVVFLLAKVSPFKTESHPSDDKQRWEMLRLAISGNEAFQADDREIRRGGVSYTVDSLRSMQQETPSAEWFLLIGADSLKDFDQWREPREILERVRLVVAERGGLDHVSWDAFQSIATPEQLRAVQERKLDAPKIEIASRDLRRRVRDGRSIRYLVPPAVEAFIHEQRLWLPAATGTP